MSDYQDTKLRTFGEETPDAGWPSYMGLSVLEQ
jgi:hypothetical protein